MTTFDRHNTRLLDFGIPMINDHKTNPSVMPTTKTSSLHLLTSYTLAFWACKACLSVTSLLLPIF